MRYTNYKFKNLHYVRRRRRKCYYKIKKPNDSFRALFGLGYIRAILIILTIALCCLGLSAYLYKNDNILISSLLGNIFAGLFTGLVLLTVTNIKNIGKYKDPIYIKGLRLLNEKLISIKKDIETIIYDFESNKIINLKQLTVQLFDAITNNQDIKEYPRKYNYILKAYKKIASQESDDDYYYKKYRDYKKRDFDNKHQNDYIKGMLEYYCKERLKNLIKFGKRIERLSNFVSSEIRVYNLRRHLRKKSLF